MKTTTSDRKIMIRHRPVIIDLEESRQQSISSYQANVNNSSYTSLSTAVTVTTDMPLSTSENHPEGGRLSRFLRSRFAVLGLIVSVSLLSASSTTIMYGDVIHGKQRKNLTRTIVLSNLATDPHVAQKRITFSISLFSSSTHNNDSSRSSQTVVMIPNPFRKHSSSRGKSKHHSHHHGHRNHHDHYHDEEEEDEATKPDFGDIDFSPISKKARFARIFDSEKDEKRLNKEIAEKLKFLDKHKQNWYASRSEPDKYDHYDELDYPKESGCYKPQWAYAYYPSCNNFHELSLDRPAPAAHVPDSLNLQTMDVMYAGHGHFREGWVIQDTTFKKGFDFAMKTIRLYEREDDKDDYTFSPYSITHTQSEALAMLHTSGSSRTTNTYGHCSTSIMVETAKSFGSQIITLWGTHNQTKLDALQVDDVKAFNHLTKEQKLLMALAMAESLADLHGNKEGVIVNNDLGVEQWLVGKDGQIKLNDFNKAKVLQWNPTKKEYCKFRSHQGLAFFAPEEIFGADVDDSADVGSFGKIMYMVLTGLKPYYQISGLKKMHKAIDSGEYPYLDPRWRTRSMIEGRFVEIMEALWPRDPTKRPDIFWVVEQLRETAREAFGKDYRKQMVFNF